MGFRALFTGKGAGHTRATQPVPPSNPFTAAGRTARGEVSASGDVAPWNQLQPYGGQPTAITPPAVQPVGNPAWVQPLPDSLYVTRALRGGAATFPARGTMMMMPPMTGGHVVMANRPDLVAREDQPTMDAQPGMVAASWREAPSVVQLCRTTREVR